MKPPQLNPNRRLIEAWFALDDLGRALSKPTGKPPGELQHDGSGFRSEAYLERAEKVEQMRGKEPDNG